MAKQFDQIDAQLARIEKNMMTVWDVQVAVACSTIVIAMVVAFVLWWV